MKKLMTTLLLLILVSPLSADMMVSRGEPVPSISVTTSEGSILKLDSLKGKVVIINFWATWCPPCVAEMPDLNKLYQLYHKKGLEIVAIANPRDSIERVEAFFKSRGIKFNYYIDTDFSAARTFGVRALPTSIIVGRDGIIRNIIIGGRPWTSASSREYFEKLLKEGEKNGKNKKK